MQRPQRFLLLLWLDTGVLITKTMAGQFHYPGFDQLPVVAQTVAFSSGSPVQPYVRMYALSLAQCCVECALRKRCAAFTYKRQYQRCDLLPVLDFVEMWTSTEQGMIMGNMTENTRNILLEDCGLTNCGIGEKCFQTENNVSQCVISECGPLELGPNLVQGSFLNYIGAKIQIHCTTNTRAITNTTIIECQDNGEWTAIPADFCGGPCADMWEEFSGECYLIPDTLTKWKDAIDYCQLHGAQLATVRSVNVHSFLVQTILELGRPGESYWIGATYTTGTWHWYTEDEPLGVTFWHPTYPTAAASDTCVKYQMLMDEMAWTNGDCNTGAFGICQRRNSEAVQTIGAVTSTTALSPPGQSPATKSSPRTTTLAPTTRTTTTEVVTDLPELCTAPWEYFGDFCYYFVPKLFTWDNAERFCNSEGSLLTSSIDNEENDFIIGVLDSLDRYPGSTNLAVGRMTSQSSTTSTLESLLAVDGFYGSSMDTNLCSQPTQEDRPWWMVELDQEYEIHRVVINTRADCCGNEVQSLKVFTGPDRGSATNYCGTYEGTVLDGATTIICEEGVVGNVVKVELTPFGTLSLCEVEIFEAVRYSETINLALLRSSSQSSIFETATPDHAVDGFNNAEHTEMSCAVTRDEGAPWWLVDLGRQYPVKRIVIKPADPAAFAYTGLHDILVYVEETAHADLSEDVCGQYAGPSNTDEEVEIVCERTIVGQFVKILMTSFGSLVLCEIQIYADETFSTSYWIGKSSDGIGVASVPVGNICPRYERNDDGVFSMTESLSLQESYSICKKPTGPS